MEVGTFSMVVPLRYFSYLKRAKIDTVTREKGKLETKIHVRVK